MKKLLIILLALGLTAVVWTRQSAQRRLLVEEHERLAAALTEQEARGRQADAARQSAAERAADLRSQLDLRKATVAAAPARRAVVQPTSEPDPGHQGGWPSHADYLYLSKQYLTNVQYRLMSGGQLSDEAAALLGMSATERATVNQSLSDLFHEVRQLELIRMKPIPSPEGWSGATFGAKLDSTVAYQIPSLGSNGAAARQALSQQLEQTLGSSRARLLEPNLDSYLRQNMDDLGAEARVIGFLSATESDGSPTVWYGIADARHGSGSFQRIPEDIDPNSQIAYYANLFGVKLPGKQ